MRYCVWLQNGRGELSLPSEGILSALEGVKMFLRGLDRGMRSQATVTQFDEQSFTPPPKLRTYKDLQKLINDGKLEYVPPSQYDWL